MATWRWLKLVILLALPLAAVASAGEEEAVAETNPQFTAMVVSVLPEYDQPAVLVTVQGELNPDVSLPTEVSLRLPRDATIERACSINPPDEPICQPYSTGPDGEYFALTYEVVTPSMYVEFHYGSVSEAGERSLDFTFWPSYPVESLHVFVTEPTGATDFTLIPSPADTVEEQGSRHHVYTFRDQPADKPVDIEMTYSRETNQPSMSLEAVAATADGDGGGLPQAVILSLALGGAAVFGFVLYLAFGRRFRTRLVAAGRQEADREVTKSRAGALFCRHCGHRLQQGFAFCPDCGRDVHLPLKE
jgi:hypothetical protein